MAKLFSLTMTTLKRRTNMKVISIIALLFCLYTCPVALGKHNVTVKLTVDDYVGGVEQDVYLWRLEGNRYLIDDSIHIIPHKDTYILHSNVAYESRIILLFPKRGPLTCILIVHPNEDVIVNVTKDDHQLGYMNKRLVSGSAANEAIVRLWGKIDSCKDKKLEIERKYKYAGRISKTDSINMSKEKKIIDDSKISIIKEIAEKTPYPIVAEEAQGLIISDIPKEEYNALANYNSTRFADYFRLKEQYADSLKKCDSNQFIENRKFIKSKELSRVKINAISHNNISRPNLGTKISLNLCDSLGTICPTSKFLGKFVLIELWASWCAPCIESMPSIIGLQKKYSKDLTCLALTIDKDYYLWQKAINNYCFKDLLHFKATNSQGIIYEDLKFLIADGTIPQNYLLDREGKIIAINIYGEELFNKLEELTKKK